MKLLLFKRPKAEHPYLPASLAEHGISCVEVEPSFFSAISALKAAKAVDAHGVDAVLVCRYADAMAAVSARKLARRPFKIIYLAQANSPAPDRCLLAIRAQIDGWIFQSERLRSLYPADLVDCAVIHPAPAQIDLPGLAPCGNARLWVGPIDGNAQRLRQVVEEACASGGAARLVVCGTGKASEVMPIVRRSRLAPDAVEWLGAEYDLAAQASKAACVVQAGLDPIPLELALAASGLPLVSPAGIPAAAPGDIGQAADYIKKFR